MPQGWTPKSDLDFQMMAGRSRHCPEDVGGAHHHCEKCQKVVLSPYAHYVRVINDVAAKLSGKEVGFEGWTCG